MVGVAKLRSMSRKQILEAANRCVYCEKTDELQLEHMPPRGIFEKDRPSGWEFACCPRCNQGTRGADAVAIFLSHIEMIDKAPWKVPKLLKVRGAIERYAPGVYDEIFSDERWRDSYVKSRGVLVPVKTGSVDGPLLKKYLDIFSAKAAMSAFMHFANRPLTPGGLIYTEWFTNAGMTQKVFDAVVSIMPCHAQLSQGVKKSGEQFQLRYNTDNSGVIAALMSFHSSFFVLCIATDRGDLAEPLRDLLSKGVMAGRETGNITTPGLRELDEL